MLIKISRRLDLTSIIGNQLIGSLVSRFSISQTPNLSKYFHSPLNFELSRVTCNSYIQFDLWVFFFISKLKAVIYNSLEYTCTSVSSLMSLQHRSLKILSGQYIYMSRFTLLTLKLIVVINSLGCSVYKVWCLSSKGFSRYLSGQYIPMSSLTLDIWLKK
jgi:hypothetical protein